MSKSLFLLRVGRMNPINHKNQDDATVLKTAEEEFSEFFHCAAEGIFSADVNKKKLKYVNPALCGMLGYSEDELKHMYMKDIHPREDWKRVVSTFESNVRDDGNCITDVPCLKKNGTRIFVDIRASRILLNGNEYFFGFYTDITEHKNLSEALKKSEEKYRGLVERTGLGILIINTRGLGIYANDALCKMIGYNREEIIGKHFTSYLHPDDKRKMLKIFWNSFIHQDRDIQLDFRVIHKEGHFVHLWCEPTVTRYQNKIIEINGIILDVTERKRMEEALRESEEKYRTITENINVGIYRNTPGIEGCFIEANLAAARIFGYENKDEFLNTKVAAHYQNPEDRKKFDRKMARKKLVQNEELLLRKKDGTLIWGAVTAKAIFDEKVNVKFYDGVIEDITERKRIEEALRKSEERYRHYVSNSSEGIWRIEFDQPLPIKISENEIIRQIYKFGYIAECNEVIARMYGFASADEVKGKRLVSLHGGPDNPDNVEAYHNLIRSGFRIVDAETQEVDNFGNIKYFLNNVTGIIEGDYILGSWGTQRDITKRKQTEERMKASLKEREVLLKEVHHRVKNNMQVISSLLHLQSQNIKNEEDLAMFKESQDRVRSMALVHDKLYRSEDFTKIDFAGYIKSLASGLYQSYSIDQRRVSLDIRVKDVSLGIDLAIPCGLIINELVSNILKHAFPTTWKGRPKMLISLSPTGDDEIELVVQDNGVGLPKDIELQKTESLGLKLVIILTEDQLGGRVNLERNKGTKFEIHFKNS